MISKRVKDISSFIVMDVLQRAQELEGAGHDVIHLEVGEPDFDTPKVIQDAAVAAIRSGKTKYTHAMGMPELREAIAAHYQREYNVTVSPGQILVSSGTSPAMLLMMLAAVENGDEVILSNPGYACYPNFIEAAGGAPVYVETSPEEGFRFTMDQIAAARTDNTSGIIINSPSNPTGVVLTQKHLQEVASLEDLYIFSDEIYHGLVYGGRARSILEFTRKAFVINGFSKLYAMTGWRLGYLIFPEEFIPVMEKIHQNFMISANSFVQIAGIAALEQAGDDVETMKEVYADRRRYTVKRLREIGFIIDVEPTGAFYVLADARHWTNDSLAFAFDILEKVYVGVTPGIDFGTGAEGFIRFSYANSMENIQKGLDRVEEYIKKFT